MSADKQTRCSRFVWAYVSRYAHTCADEIPSTVYTRAEITRSLADLVAGGQLAREQRGRGGRGYGALVPFVVELPEGLRG